MEQLLEALSEGLPLKRCREELEAAAYESELICGAMTSFTSRA